MKATLLSIGLLSWVVSLASATALTYKLSANEKACFYATSEKKGSKVAFYFAVGRLAHSCEILLLGTCQLTLPFVHRCNQAAPSI